METPEWMRNGIGRWAVSEHDGYLYQGRQQHGWFGHGTKPHEAGSSDGTAGIPAPETFEKRLDSIIYGMIAAVPKRERAMVETRMDVTARARLRGAMLAWAGADRLDRAAFRAHFLPSTGDAAVDLLRLAASAAQQAHTYADRRHGSELLGAAVREVGAYRWPALVAEAGQRAANALVLPVVDRRPVPEAPVAPGTSPFTVDGSMPDLTPVPLLDDNGRPMLKEEGENVVEAIQRPAGVDLHFFAERGAEPVPGDENSSGWIGKLMADLQQFRIGGPWDTQRIDGHFHREFRDFATVVIGLYGAAAGIPKKILLTMQDIYAK